MDANNAANVSLDERHPNVKEDIMTTYKTRCGGIMHITQKAKSHLQAHPEVLSFLQNGIERISLPKDGQKYEGEIDFGRVIGRSGLTRTSPLGVGNQADFTVRKGRTLPSRVVSTNQIGEETTKIVVVARPTFEEKHYELITSWMGPLAKKEPWDPSIKTIEEFRESLKFWTSFALVYKPQVMGPIWTSTCMKILNENNCRFLQFL